MELFMKINRHINSILMPSVLAVYLLSSSAVMALEANKTKDTLIIDGIANETSWNKAPWYPLDKHILGVIPTAEDFSGRFKFLWDEKKLYILAEITDDVLFDQHADPLHFYWDDDCLEIFVDEDNSGGDHQFNFNAFAYHLALDNQAVDIGPNRADGSTQFITLNDHVQSRWQRNSNAPNNVIWEVALSIYDDTFTLNGNNKPVILTKGKTLGFMLAYCDNDASKHRESFIGSTAIKPVNGDKNLGYKTADVFDSLRLIEE